MKRLDFNEITRRREEKGWSQNRLAREAGISGPSLSMMFTGKRNPSLERAIALAEALECTIDELLMDECDADEDRTAA